VAARAQPHATGFGLVVMLREIPGVTAKEVKGILPFTFQCPPLNNFPINRSYPHTDYDPIEGGQRSKPGSVQLEVYAWRTLFTWDVARWTLLHGEGYTPNPLEMLEKLDRIGKSGKPVHLTARHPKFWDRYEVNTPATLRSCNSEEVQGEFDTRYADIQFVEYRETSLETMQQGGASGGGGSNKGSGLPGGGRDSKLPVVIDSKQLGPGKDTLYELARTYYGDPSDWRLIAKANGLSVAPTYDLNKLGNRKIKIPKKPG
jgi:hypothetical protein